MHLTSFAGWIYKIDVAVEHAQQLRFVRQSIDLCKSYICVFGKFRTYKANHLRFDGFYF